MFAGPSRRLFIKGFCTAKTTNYPTLYRSWSSSLIREAKRKRPPTYYKEVKEVSQPRAPQLDWKPSDYYVSPELASSLRRLGIVSIPAVVKILRQLCQEVRKYSPSVALDLISSNKRYIQYFEEAVSGDEVVLISNRKILGKALHALGKNDFHQQNRKWNNGLHSLHMALAAGETEACIDAAAAEILLIQLSQRDPTTEIKRFMPLALFNLVREKALAKTDWRAMTLYVSIMNREQRQTKEAAQTDYELAKELDNMLEPGKQQSGEGNPLREFERPWKLLHDAAEQYLSHLSPQEPIFFQVQTDLERALRDGAFKYSEPRAIPMVLGRGEMVEKHSTQWVTLSTQAAVAGSADSALHLAFYHLHKDGWLPAQSAATPKIWVGLEWLALSAAQAAPNTNHMAARYLALAHLLREHGFTEEGYSWIKFAQENIREAGLDPDDAWHNYLDGFMQTWTNPAYTQKSSADFLREPS